ncbi:hypothetical protein E3N88_38398 [Mikania micrantha]|uniref:CCHC-type domain-containing protein n=1 Tax=Mikania micrantha TaxID=192012 RepID=A0A5N6LTV0_9ASTR|nr:hypothetical protein E3N88_38398 [Mikania micrantha]
MRNVKYKPKLDSRKHHCENSGIRARLGKNPYTTYVRNPNLRKHSKNQKIEIVQSDSDETHVRRDETGWKGKHKLHPEMRLSVSHKFEHGFQKDDTAGTSKGKAKCFEQGCVPVKTSFDSHIKPRSKKKTRIWCYKCHEYGHKISECPSVSILCLTLELLVGNSNQKIILCLEQIMEIGMKFGL